MMACNPDVRFTLFRQEARQTGKGGEKKMLKMKG